MLKRFITNFPIKKFMEYYQSVCGYVVQRGNPITNPWGREASSILHADQNT